MKVYESQQWDEIAVLRLYFPWYVCINTKIQNNMISTKKIAWGSKKGTMIPQEGKRKGSYWVF